MLLKLYENSITLSSEISVDTQCPALHFYPLLVCLATTYPEAYALLCSLSKMHLQAYLESFQALIRAVKFKWKGLRRLKEEIMEENEKPFLGRSCLKKVEHRYSHCKCIKCHELCFNN